MESGIESSVFQNLSELSSTVSSLAYQNASSPLANGSIDGNSSGDGEGGGGGGAYGGGWYVNNNSVLIIALETLLYVTLSIVISCSSLLSIMVVWTTSGLHTSPGFLMVIMSMCDVLLSTILAMSTVNVILRKNVFPQWVNVALAMMFATFQNGNAMALMVSAIDQCISILKPLHYPLISTPRRILVVFVSMLLVSLLFVLYLTYASYSYTQKVKQAGGQQLSMLYYDELTHLQFVACYGEVTPHLAMLFFVLPGAVVLVCYGVIFIVVVKQRQEIRRMQAQLTSMAARRGSVASGLQFLSHIKACRMLFIVTLVYFLGFLPYMLMDRYINDQLQTEREPKLPPLWSYKLATWLIMAQSLLNCAIFYRMNSKFKQGFHRLLNKYCPSIFQCIRNCLHFRQATNNVPRNDTACTQLARLDGGGGNLPSLSNFADTEITPPPSVQIATPDEIHPRVMNSSA
ncbi:orexin/Hypocretin receptor type 1-like [Symsagittifera roscoffensis]|uniref:orexin/Hypocretin receptor type 1-like n=1 Tax=Symsagittifera roscoffensis TaxID=84072 RepID=UPI00307C94A3